MVKSAQKAFGDRPRAMVICFALIVALAGLFTLPPLDRDEARFAQASAQMLESGDYLSINFLDQERNKKPAGIYWMQAASVSVLSSPEARAIWAYRVPSALGAVFAALFTYLAARRLFGSETALLAAFLLSASPLLAAEATIAKTDAMLLALICLAQWMLIEIYASHKQDRPVPRYFALIFWIAHGAAILIKGPIGPMVSVLTVIGIFAIDRKAGWMRGLRPILGVIIIIAIVGPWGFAIHQATDGRFFADAIGGDMLGKVGQAQESHIGPPGYHLLLLWPLFWPAAVIIGPAFLNAWKMRNDWRIGALLAWIIPSWIVFEFAATKLPHYVLPAYPAIAMLVAYAALSGTPLRHTKVSALAFGGIGLFFAGIIVATPYFLSGNALRPTPIILAIALISGIVWTTLKFWRGDNKSALFAATGLSAAFAWIMMGLILPSLSSLQVSPQLATTLADLGRHPMENASGPVALAGYTEPSAAFLIGTNTIMTNGAEAGHQLSTGEIATAAIEAGEAPAFLAAAPNAVSLGVVRGLNYSNGDPVEITIYANGLEGDR